METLLWNIIEWLKSQDPLETCGVVTGVVCVYLAAKNNIWNWPIGLVSVGIYIFVFGNAKLYADAALQCYFLLTGLYGWYYWSQNPTSLEKVKVARLTQKQIWVSILVIGMLTPVLGFVLQQGTDASFPFIDSFCAATSVVAQVFLARKVIENWLLWILVDVIYMVVYCFKELHLTAGLYIIYLYLAAQAYREWSSLYHSQHPGGSLARS